MEIDDAGYLLGWELRESVAAVVITNTNAEGVPGVHRDDCSYFKPDHSWPTVQPEIGALVFEAEQQRNRVGGPRTAYFCPRCMVKEARQNDEQK